MESCLRVETEDESLLVLFDFMKIQLMLTFVGLRWARKNKDHASRMKHDYKEAEICVLRKNMVFLRKSPVSESKIPLKTSKLSSRCPHSPVCFCFCFFLFPDSLMHSSLLSWVKHFLVL